MEFSAFPAFDRAADQLTRSTKNSSLKPKANWEIFAIRCSMPQAIAHRAASLVVAELSKHVRHSNWFVFVRVLQLNMSKPRNIFRATDCNATRVVSLTTTKARGGRKICSKNDCLPFFNARIFHEFNSQRLSATKLHKRISHHLWSSFACALQPWPWQRNYVRWMNRRAHGATWSFSVCLPDFKKYVWKV